MENKKESFGSSMVDEQDINLTNEEINDIAFLEKESFGVPCNQGMLDAFYGIELFDRKGLLDEIDLHVSIDYVNQWGLNEALRELYQNSIDREIESENSNLVSDFLSNNELLVVGNLNSNLNLGSLIFGNSDKKNDSSQMGCNGEGFKIACLVLIRLGYRVCIFNRDKIWVPEVVFSEKFKVELLRFSIYCFDSLSIQENNSVLFFISGISKDDFDKYKSKNLLLQPEVKMFDDTSFGRIIYDKDHVSKVYVNGLFICKIPGDGFCCGYDLKPDVIKLDRDRMLVSTFDLSWLSKRMFSEIYEKSSDKIVELIEESATDVDYFIENGDGKAVKHIADRVYLKFKNKYGEKAIPVSIEGDKFRFRENSGIRFVFVPIKIRDACMASPNFKLDLDSYEKIKIRSPFEILKDFLSENIDYFPPHLILEFEAEIIKRSENWVEKEDYV